MLDDFMVRATLAGIGVAIAAAPLGCFVVWRRMAYFGEATAHAALLGISLSLMFEFSVFAGAAAIATPIPARVALIMKSSSITVIYPAFVFFVVMLVKSKCTIYI